MHTAQCLAASTYMVLNLDIAENKMRDLKVSIDVGSLIILFVFLRLCREPIME